MCLVNKGIKTPELPIYVLFLKITFFVVMYVKLMSEVTCRWNFMKIWSTCLQMCYTIFNWLWGNSYVLKSFDQSYINCPTKPPFKFIFLICHRHSHACTERHTCVTYMYTWVLLVFNSNERLFGSLFETMGSHYFSQNNESDLFVLCSLKSLHHRLSLK